MAILYLNLATVFLASLIARVTRQSSLYHSERNLASQIFVLLAMTSLVIVSGLRNNIGDTFLYMHAYSLNQFGIEDIQFQGDFGFNLYQMLLQQITLDPQILIFTTALITNVLIIKVLYQQSNLFELSVYVFIASGLFTVSMNGIRQFMAAAIIFTATKYLIEGNFKKYLIIVLLATTIHQSAIIFLPVYFVVRRKAWTKATFVLLGLAVLLVLGWDQFSSVLFSAIGDSQYGHYKDFSEGGANVMRLVVDLIPVVIAYMGRDKLRQIYPKGDCIINLAVLNVIVMLVASQNWIFARFTIYFGLYHLILISWIACLFRKKDRKLFYYGLIVSYFAYFFYEQVLSLNIQYSSDYLNF